MSKLDRSNAAETYTVGFVPSYLLPDKRPNSLDPFLHTLVADLEKGFIEGARKSTCYMLYAVIVKWQGSLAQGKSQHGGWFFLGWDYFRRNSNKLFFVVCLKKNSQFSAKTNTR